MGRNDHLGHQRVRLNALNAGGRSERVALKIVRYSPVGGGQNFTEHAPDGFISTGEILIAPGRSVTVNGFPDNGAPAGFRAEIKELTNTDGASDLCYTLEVFDTQTGKTVGTHGFTWDEDLVTFVGRGFETHGEVGGAGSAVKLGVSRSFPRAAPSSVRTARTDTRAQAHTM